VRDASCAGRVAVKPRVKVAQSSAAQGDAYGSRAWPRCDIRTRHRIGRSTPAASACCLDASHHRTRVSRRQTREFGCWTQLTLGPHYTDVALVLAERERQLPSNSSRNLGRELVQARFRRRTCPAGAAVCGGSASPAEHEGAGPRWQRRSRSLRREQDLVRGFSACRASIHY
jgi:hypothetical protein